MEFVLGTTRWHIVGTKKDRPVLLCARSFDRMGPGGDAVDVATSGMPVCGTCDRMTNGQAIALIRTIKETT